MSEHADQFEDRDENAQGRGRAMVSRKRSPSPDRSIRTGEAMRAFTVRAKSFDSAQRLLEALRSFDPVLDGYSVSVDVGTTDRRLLDVLDAIQRHIHKGMPQRASSLTDAIAPVRPARAKRSHHEVPARRLLLRRDF